MNKIKMQILGVQQDTQLHNFKVVGFPNCAPAAYFANGQDALEYRDLKNQEVKLKSLDVIESEGKFYIIAKLQGVFEIQMSLASSFVTRENAERFLRWFKGAEVFSRLDQMREEMRDINSLRQKEGRP